MATKAEQARAATERKNAAAHAPKREAKRALAARKKRSIAQDRHESGHAGKKATYALDTSTKARPSRKSTRKAANRMKADTNLTLREERTKGSPESIARKIATKAKRVRGRGTV